MTFKVQYQNHVLENPPSYPQSHKRAKLTQSAQPLLSQVMQVVFTKYITPCFYPHELAQRASISQTWRKFSEQQLLDHSDHLNQKYCEDIAEAIPKLSKQMMQQKMSLIGQILISISPSVNLWTQNRYDSYFEGLCEAFANPEQLNEAVSAVSAQLQNTYIKSLPKFSAHPDLLRIHAHITGSCLHHFLSQTAGTINETKEDFNLQMPELIFQAKNPFFPQLNKCINKAFELYDAISPYTQGGKIGLPKCILSMIETDFPLAVAICHLNSHSGWRWQDTQHNRINTAATRLMQKKTDHAYISHNFYQAIEASTTLGQLSRSECFHDIFEYNDPEEIERIEKDALGIAILRELSKWGDHTTVSEHLHVLGEEELADGNIDKALLYFNHIKDPSHAAKVLKMLDPMVDNLGNEEDLKQEKDKKTLAAINQTRKILRLYFEEQKE